MDWVDAAEEVETASDAFKAGHGDDGTFRAVGGNRTGGPEQREKMLLIHFNFD